jgi:hypothetical protein
MRVQYAVGIALTAALLIPAARAIQAQTAPPVLKKLAPPIQGSAELGYMKDTKVQGNDIVTTFQVKNLDTRGAIVGLQITEDWYDKSKARVQGTGDRQRLKTPLLPGEVATITLRSPRVPNMGTMTPALTFQHNNGPIKLTLLKSMK